MTNYLLITEPARGTSVRVDVLPDQHPDMALLAWLGEDDGTVVGYREHQSECRASGADAEDFVDYYAGTTGDRVEVIDETRHVYMPPDPKVQAKATIKSVRDLIIDLIRQGAIADKVDIEVRPHDEPDAINIEFEDGACFRLNLETNNYNMETITMTIYRGALRQPTTAIKHRVDTLMAANGWEQWDTGGHIVCWGKAGRNGQTYLLTSFDERIADDLYDKPTSTHWGVSRTSEDGYTDDDQDFSCANGGLTLFAAFAAVEADIASLALTVLDANCG